MCNFSQGVWDRAMEKGMAEGMKKGMEKGMAEGMKKGMEKGIAEGKTKAMAFMLNKLIQNMKVTKEQAADVLEIPGEEREKYFSMLQQ